MALLHEPDKRGVHLIHLVEDDESASDAALKVVSIVRRLAETRRRVMDLAHPLTAEEDRRLQDRYGDQIECAARSVIAEVQRIKQLDEGQQALAAMEAFAAEFR